MNTDRFETFADAIIAIIITVLVLKFSQPSEATLTGLWNLRIEYLAYVLSFLIIFNIWYGNHNLFQLVNQIDNITVLLNGILLFILSLIPYFTKWLADNLYSTAPETMIGIIFILTHIIHMLSVKSVLRNDPYNKKLQESININIYNHIPLILILTGFILTYTVFKPGICICCFISIILWMIIEKYNKGDLNEN